MVFFIGACIHVGTHLSNWVPSYTALLVLKYNVMVSLPSDNGVTAAGFALSDAEEFDDLELTNFGKKKLIKALALAQNSMQTRSN